MIYLPKNIQTVYFLGIGGIGMSALARYFKQMGCNVFGYDKTPSPLTTQLENEGISIHFEENVSLLPPKIDLVVYTPAIPQSNVEYQYLKKNNPLMLKRSEVLGAISKEKYTVAVAGTHGKTSVSSIITLLLHKQEPVTSFVGGISLNFNSNFINDKNSQTIIVEADEYDRSFLNLSPDLAVITSMDADHLDIYGDEKCMHEAFNEFVGNIKPTGCLVAKPELRSLIRFSGKTYTYSLFDSQADFYIKKLEIENNHYLFDLQMADGSMIEKATFPALGYHNLENAVAASAVAYLKQVPKQTIQEGLQAYKGVKRRFEYVLQNNEIVYIDDYAHHPNELKACLQSVREIFPNKKMCGIFQPHLFSRTRDFMNDFARSLELLDQVILLNIYPAREEPISGIDANVLLSKINKEEKWLLADDEVVDFLQKLRPELLLTLGAGDIDRLVEKIKNIFQK